jgi:hypothetical protein
MLAPFEASQIKIDRAKRHLQELTAEISSFFERGAVSVVIEQASEYASVPGEMWAFTYRETEPIPATWSAIIGDVLHNLRTSLDLIASDVHRITGGKAKDTKHVHYPFCETKSDLPEMIRLRRLSGIGRDFRDAIEKTAPYKGGNEGLRAIHDLDLLDKHQALVPTIAIVSLPWPVPIHEGPQNFTAANAKDGQRLILFPRAFCQLPSGSKMQADFSILFDVGIFKHRDVIKQLNACLTSVEVILGLFRETANKTKAASGIARP